MRFFMIDYTGESRKENRWFIIEIHSDGRREPSETAGTRFVLRRDCKDHLIKTFKAKQGRGGFVSQN